MSRSHVPFDGIWSMAIDVPVSYLVRDGDLAWSCGQLALDIDSNVIHPGNLPRQSEVVADYISQILARLDLSANGLKRLYLYHAAPDATAAAEMVAIFRDRFGSALQLQPIEVPYFYYDGVLLEVDLWWSDESTMTWKTDSSPQVDASRLSEHMVMPSGQLQHAVRVPDPGAIIDGGPRIVEPLFLSVNLPGRSIETGIDQLDSVVAVVRQTDGFAWVQGRCTDPNLGLVEQTEAIMARIDAILPSIGLAYEDVAKSTTHYVGGSTADELHSNMSVRNKRYAKPGPASTGLPVFGFADPASLIVVDITLVRRVPLVRPRLAQTPSRWSRS